MLSLASLTTTWVLPDTKCWWFWCLASPTRLYGPRPGNGALLVWVPASAPLQTAAEISRMPLSHTFMIRTHLAPNLAAPNHLTAILQLWGPWMERGLVPRKCFKCQLSISSFVIFINGFLFSKFQFFFVKWKLRPW